MDKYVYYVNIRLGTAVYSAKFGIYGVFNKLLEDFGLPADMQDLSITAKTCMSAYSRAKRFSFRYKGQRCLIYCSRTEPHNKVKQE